LGGRNPLPLRQGGGKRARLLSVNAKNGVREKKDWPGKAGEKEKRGEMPLPKREKKGGSLFSKVKKARRLVVYKSANIGRKIKAQPPLRGKKKKKGESLFESSEKAKKKNVF